MPLNFDKPLLRLNLIGVVAVYSSISALKSAPSIAQTAKEPTWFSLTAISANVRSLPAANRAGKFELGTGDRDWKNQVGETPQIPGKEGRRQDAEGRREEFERSLNPAQFLATQSEIRVGDSDPCSLAVARTSGQRVETLPSALCPRTSAFPIEAIAQASLPNPVLPIPTPQPETPTPSRLPPPEELLQPSTPTPTRPEEDPNIPGTITVDRFEVVGSTVFSQEEFASVLANFVNRPITFAELLQARSAVTQLYVRKGYITSGALIPPQTLAGGTVKIQVIEGRLESIDITGTRRLNPNYVKSRLAIATEAPLNQDRLLEALQLLQLNPLIENISAELQAGSRPGSNLLEVRIKEAKTLHGRLFADNGRSPSVGSFRRGAEVSEANLLGYGDSIGLTYNNTEGSNAVDFNYTLPVNPRNGTISLQLSRSRSRIVEPPFDELDIEAFSRDYELAYRQPLVQTPTREIALGIAATRRESDTSLLGVDFPLSPGADDRGRTRLLAVRAFQEYTQRGTQEVFAARSQFSLGIGAFDATVNSNAPDSWFLAWRGQAQYLRVLAPDTLLLLRSDVQLAPGELVPLEQIGLGGLDTVRGYRQDALLADNGVFLSAELRYPIYRTQDREGVLQVTPFIDFGKAWNSGGNPAPDSSTLLSAGLGLRWQYSDRVTARLNWGIPLLDNQSSNKTLQEKGIYFSVEFKP